MDLIACARQAAFEEIGRHALPNPFHLELSFREGQRLARELGADVEVVGVGTLLMDLKLGVAFSQGRLAEHVAMSVEGSRELLEQWGVDASRRETIIGCVASHHGASPYPSLEAEICANADCYRFLHPAGLFRFAMTLGKRSDDLAATLNQLESKVDEKLRVLSLDACKRELEPHAAALKALFAASRSRL